MPTCNHENTKFIILESNSIGIQPESCFILMFCTLKYVHYVDVITLKKNSFTQ